MRIIHASFILALLVSSTAGADSQLGATAGIDYPGDDSPTGNWTSFGLYGRTRIVDRLAAELDAAWMSVPVVCHGMYPDECAGPQAVSGSAVAVADLARGAVVPTARAGVGLDYLWESAAAVSYHADWTYVHAELGAGLEYRARHWVVGAVATVGARTQIAQHDPQGMPSWPDGLYASARFVVGARF